MGCRKSEFLKCTISIELNQLQNEVFNIEELILYLEIGQF